MAHGKLAAPEFGQIENDLTLREYQTDSITEWF